MKPSEPFRRMIRRLAPNEAYGQLASLLDASLRNSDIASFLKKLLGVKQYVVRISRGNFFIDQHSNFGQGVLAENGYEPKMAVHSRR